MNKKVHVTLSGMEERGLIGAAPGVENRQLDPLIIARLSEAIETALRWLNKQRDCRGRRQRKHKQVYIEF